AQALPEQRERRVDPIRVQIREGVVDEAHPFEAARLRAEADVLRRAQRDVVGLSSIDSVAHRSCPLEEEDGEGGAPLRGASSLSLSLYLSLSGFPSRGPRVNRTFTPFEWRDERRTADNRSTNENGCGTYYIFQRNLKVVGNLAETPAFAR